MQIFTYKDMSVCNVSSPNFHMFYDKRRVSTQIYRLCHVHAQVHTLKDMSFHTVCLMEMCPSTVDTQFPITSSGAKELLMSCSL